MPYVVQCNRCKKDNLSWKFDVNYSNPSAKVIQPIAPVSCYYITTKRSLQGFNQTPVRDSYLGIVKGCGVLDFDCSDKVPMINLCENCWACEAAKWYPKTSYATVPAKTTKDGVYFNNDRPDYFQGGRRGGEPDIDKIVSTAVHEMSHYWSNDATHNGLVAAKELSNKLNWDECVTDFLARKTYFGVRHGTYKTNYGRLSEFISTAVRQAAASSPENRRLLGLFPEPFRSLAINQRQGEVEQALARKFVTWYLKGGDEPVDGQKMAQFFSQEIVEQKEQIMPRIGTRIPERIEKWEAKTKLVDVLFSNLGSLGSGEPTGFPE